MFIIAGRLAAQAARNRMKGSGPEMKERGKVVGIGLNKTGTSTLGVCLQHWNMKHTSYSLEAFRAWRERDYTRALRQASHFDSFEDWPWPLLYKEFDRAFPDTKFILTRRKDAETWFESLRKHAELTGPTEFRKVIYGYAMPHKHKDEHIRFYEQHLEEIRRYFKTRPGDLLEVCWEEGDGWDKLAGFLGLARPEVPFPHANKAHK